ncbi:hypothetical protein H6785_04160 [Candidatus Nomurabacteria bacterium]|nr:hypothetical protein [Candidatus Kaiserbacteria bacterium]MCB9815742.1 hypothetical protein [Candidatus Nomurabacteria bacterium]
MDRQYLGGTDESDFVVVLETWLIAFVGWIPLAFIFYVDISSKNPSSAPITCLVIGALSGLMLAKCYTSLLKEWKSG